MAVTYTATVEVTGEGRNGGTARSSDGLLEHRLAIPKELGGTSDATNPEQLFAAGWAAHGFCPYSKATRGNIPVTIDASAV
ncbi:organic hydroperoxide reductase OsmC/OhrA [Catenulispora sp. GP43]|uniref:hypothetical protein n=1 Tax=Catenulispora sp. GP43 TaxID=3156263 RepID=UPI0035118745